MTARHHVIEQQRVTSTPDATTRRLTSTWEMVATWQGRAGALTAGERAQAAQSGQRVDVALSLPADAAGLWTTEDRFEVVVGPLGLLGPFEVVSVLETGRGPRVIGRRRDG